MDSPNLWGIQQPLDLMGCHMVWKALWLWAHAQKQPPSAPPPKKNTFAALMSRWRWFCVVSCFIILKGGHYLWIVFIFCFCQPQNVKQSVIEGRMGQRSPTSAGSLAVSAPGSGFTITSPQTKKNRRENVSQRWWHQIEAEIKATFVFPSSQRLPGWPDTVCCASQ